MSKNQKEGVGAIKKHIDPKNVEIPLYAKAKRIKQTSKYHIILQEEDTDIKLEDII